MIEDGPFKYWLLAALRAVGLTATIGYSCNYYHDIDARAPIVETCITHPITRSPFDRGVVR